MCVSWPLDRGLQHWHWPWPGQTVNGSDCHHGPGPGGTCPNNKDRNMEEVSSQQIPTATTQHVSNSIDGVIVTAQLYIVTLNFSCRDMQWRTRGISSAALTSRDVLWVSDTRAVTIFLIDDDLMHTARCESQWVVGYCSSERMNALRTILKRVTSKQRFAPKAQTVSPHHIMVSTGRPRDSWPRYVFIMGNYSFKCCRKGGRFIYSCTKRIL